MRDKFLRLWGLCELDTCEIWIQYYMLSCILLGNAFLSPHKPENEEQTIAYKICEYFHATIRTCAIVVGITALITAIVCFC